MLLCSLSGDIFPKVQQAHNQPVSSNPAKDGHLRQMLGLVGVWLGDPQAAVHQAAANDEAPLLDACRFGLIYLANNCIAAPAALCWLKATSKPVAVSIVISIIITHVTV